MSVEKKAVETVKALAVGGVPAAANVVVKAAVRNLTRDSDSKPSR